MKLSIRRVKPSDIGAIRVMSVDFNEESALEYPTVDEHEIDSHMLDMLSSLDDPNWIYLIAYDGKKPAGFFMGYVGDKPYSRPRRVGVAQELYVVPDKRGGLVGLRLMEEAAKVAVQQGAQGFECIGSYGKTDKRWEKFGFKPHVTYGHMEAEDFFNLVQRFTQGRKQEHASVQ